MFELWLHLTGLVTTSLSGHGDETDPERQTKADLSVDCVFIQGQCNGTLKYTVCYFSFVKHRLNYLYCKYSMFSTL